VNGECIGCGRCARGICPYDAITIIGDRASIGAACVGCGRCLDVCPVDAIQPAAAV
jgi:formate hydrogenlyase subunit 6/NADH:ubiquinone oxidoreductase subunit I